METKLFFSLLHESRRAKDAGLDETELHIYCQSFLAGLKRAKNHYQDEQREREINMNDYGALDAAADMREV